MKKNFNIYVDIELIAEAQMRKINLSELFNNYLREYLQIKKETLDYNAEMKVISLTAQLTTARAELEKERKNIEKAEEERNKRKRVVERYDEDGHRIF